MIIVRGGKYSTKTQLADASRRFFGEEARYEEEALPRRKSTDSHILRRTNTGVSSIVGEDNGSRPGGFVLVIDGAALQDVRRSLIIQISLSFKQSMQAQEEDSKDLLLSVAAHCEAVVACRVSPLQKALMVRLVKDNLNAMTLAIGDGANDVSMIQVRTAGFFLALANDRRDVGSPCGCGNFR